MTKFLCALLLISSASAEVKSTYAGKIKITTLTLVKENGVWKISKLG